MILEGRGGHAQPPPIPPPPLFCVAKRKNGNKGKKERLSKQKLLKGCHQGQNVTVLAILERLEFKNFSSWPTMVAGNTCQCSMAPPPWNPFRRPCSLVSQPAATKWTNLIIIIDHAILFNPKFCETVYSKIFQGGFMNQLDQTSSFTLHV